MNITLESLKTEQSRLAERIAAFEAQQPTWIGIAAATIELKHGEQYAGLVLGADGRPSHHLVLLPGEAEDIKFKKAVAWAKDQGGELPTRQEQSLLFANLKASFQSAWYWSGQVYEKDSSCAWCQSFIGGRQDYSLQSNDLRARAVRRLIIE